MRSNITGLTLKQLQDFLSEFGLPSFHARQIFSWVYKKQASDFSKMSDLPQGMRGLLKKNFTLRCVSARQILKSVDGTKKILLELCDENVIEAVLIPSGKRVTGCLSTQVGCKFACLFCASKTAGFKRNLAASEIVEEVLCLKDNSESGLLTHLVFMGIGEPLDNYDNLLNAVRIINSGEGLNIGARRITISTCGIIPAIRRLACENLQIELSISLHAADDKTRTMIMPVNKKYPLNELFRACRDYIRKTNRQVTFEYVLIKNINSGLQNAAKLCKILKGLNCKVNLIPYNRVTGMDKSGPVETEVAQFKNELLKSGINVTIRRPRGVDINAACGQLRMNYESTKS